jgi:hypothetical protein
VYVGLHLKHSLLLSDFIETNFSRQIFEKYSYTKFNENPSSGSRAVPCGQTDGGADGQADMTKLVAFHNFANAPKDSVFL